MRPCAEIDLAACETSVNEPRPLGCGVDCVEWFAFCETEVEDVEAVDGVVDDVLEHPENEQPMIDASARCNAIERQKGRASLWQWIGIVNSSTQQLQRNRF